MQVNLFALAAKQAEWLSVRQSAIPGNIANVNTPGYHALDVEPFAKVHDGKGAVSMQSTQARHLAGGGDAEAIALRQRDDGPKVLPSGNSVVLENELLDGGEVL